MWVAIWNAWVCDDAYISFRSVFMFTEGHGLTFNIDERVQTFTNPLWVLTMSVFYFFTDEAYFTSIFLSMVCTGLTAWVLVAKIGKWELTALTGLIILAFSKAFIDYSSSGLENPMTNLLIALFAWLYIREGEQKNRLLHMSIVGALCVLNRMDTLLLMAPALALVFWKERSWRSVLMVIIGFSPFIVWEIFSVIYYGFPFPNTAYAKLNSGLDAGTLAMQGLKYFRNSLFWDPITLTTVALGIVGVISFKKWKYLPLAIGIVLYCLYIVKVAGDFMSGRFFTAPVTMAVVLVILLMDRSKLWLGITAGFLLLGFFGPRNPVTLPRNIDNFTGTKLDHARIADERLWYYTVGTLNSIGSDSPIFEYEAKLDAKREIDPDTFTLLWFDNIGFIGYGVGPSYHVADKWGLADPLIARLPLAWDPDWRVGHLTRFIPEGMIFTLRHQKNLLEDADLAEYYSKLSLITRGEIWSWERFKTIIKFNLGHYDHLINWEYYANPSQVWVEWKDLPKDTPTGSIWNAKGNIEILKQRPLKVGFGKVVKPKSIEIALDGNDVYTLYFQRYEDGKLSGTHTIEPAYPESGGIYNYKIDIPADFVNEGFDRILVEPERGDGWYSIGHLKLHF